MYVRPLRNDSKQDRVLGQPSVLPRAVGAQRRGLYSQPLLHLPAGISARAHLGVRFSHKEPAQGRRQTYWSWLDRMAKAREKVLEGPGKFSKVLEGSGEFWTVLEAYTHHFWPPPYPQYIPEIGPPFQGWIPKSGEEGEGHGPRQTLFCPLCLWLLAFVRGQNAPHTLPGGRPAWACGKQGSHSHPHSQVQVHTVYTHTNTQNVQAHIRAHLCTHSNSHSSHRRRSRCEHCLAASQH